MSKQQLSDFEAVGREKSFPQIERLNSRIDKYERDKKEIQDEAKKLEARRDEARAAANQAGHRGGRMGLAVSIYQIAIAVGSICLVTKKKELWYFSILLAAAATAEMLYAWLG